MDQGLGTILLVIGGLLMGIYMSNLWIGIIALLCISGGTAIQTINIINTEEKENEKGNC